MLFRKQAIFVLTAQSVALFASGFVAPTPSFGLCSQKKSAGPLFSDVVSAVSLTAEDEAAESVVEEPELPSADEPAAAVPADKQRLTIFVGNLPFRKFLYR